MDKKKSKLKNGNMPIKFHVEEWTISDFTGNIYERSSNPDRMPSKFLNSFYGVV